MTTTAEHHDAIHAELEQLKHRLRSARIYAAVLANDPDPMASAIARQFLDYIDTAQAEPVGTVATEYRVEHRFRMFSEDSGHGWSRWNVWSLQSESAEHAEAALSIALSEGYDARIVTRTTAASPWLPVHPAADDTDKD